jgi:hypothetical protein
MGASYAQTEIRLLPMYLIKRLIKQNLHKKNPQEEVICGFLFFAGQMPDR